MRAFPGGRAGQRRGRALGTQGLGQPIRRSAPQQPLRLGPLRDTSAGVLPMADPIVRDNLGPQAPVCTAELDVIETYLDHVLRDLLASSTAGSGTPPPKSLG